MMMKHSQSCVWEDMESSVSHKNVIGSQIQTMIQNILSGSISEAAKNHRYLLPLFKAIFWVTNPAPIKYAVNKAGFNAGPLRLPMFEVDETFKSQLKSIDRKI
ncbi:MAG: hypothetical protein CM1200mP37_2060 [Chloroflexota bacterium]|nr:MAG: hypothetical protein CM1200mP37_2060 [Chloroflexota bacterium]